MLAHVNNQSIPMICASPCNWNCLYCINQAHYWQLAWAPMSSRAEKPVNSSLIRLKRTVAENLIEQGWRNTSLQLIYSTLSFWIWFNSNNNLLLHVLGEREEGRGEKREEKHKGPLFWCQPEIQWPACLLCKVLLQLFSTQLHKLNFLLFFYVDSGLTPCMCVSTK